MAVRIFAILLSILTLARSQTLEAARQLPGGVDAILCKDEMIAVATASAQKSPRKYINVDGHAEYPQNLKEYFKVFTVGGAKTVHAYEVEKWHFLIELAGRFFPGGRYDKREFLILNETHPAVVIQIDGEIPLIMYSFNALKNLKVAAEAELEKMREVKAGDVPPLSSFLAAARFKLHAGLAGIDDPFQIPVPVRDFLAQFDRVHVQSTIEEAITLAPTESILGVPPSRSKLPILYEIIKKRSQLQESQGRDLLLRLAKNKRLGIVNIPGLEDKFLIVPGHKNETPKIDISLASRPIPKIVPPNLLQQIIDSSPDLSVESPTSTPAAEAVAPKVSTVALPKDPKPQAIEKSRDDILLETLELVKSKLYRVGEADVNAEVENNLLILRNLYTSGSIREQKEVKEVLMGDENFIPDLARVYTSLTPTDVLRTSIEGFSLVLEIDAWLGITRPKPVEAAPTIRYSIWNPGTEEGGAKVEKFFASSNLPSADLMSISEKIVFHPESLKELEEYNTLADSLGKRLVMISKAPRLADLKPQWILAGEKNIAMFILGHNRFYMDQTPDGRKLFLGMTTHNDANKFATELSRRIHR